MNHLAIAIRAALATSASLTMSLPAMAQDEALATYTIEEIVVTAQKREERLQDVPLSISVVTGEQVVRSGAAQLLDIAPYIPGVQMDNTGGPGRSIIGLRGIVPIGASSTVSVHLDEAPVGSSSAYAQAANFNLDLLPYDIQRIEVLRGPQGTLYGASSIGGLVKYVTVAPSLTESSTRVGIEAFDIADGSGLGYGAHALFNTPLVADELGMTASFAYRASPGWVDNVQTGERNQNDFDQYGGRLSMLWQPNDRFSARLSGLWQRIDADDNSIVIEDLDGQRIGDGRSGFNFVPQPFENDFDYYAATLDYDFGTAALTSITTYSESDWFEVTDASRIFGSLFPLLTGGAVPEGITPFERNVGLNKFTQELRLVSQSDAPWQWLLGAFFTRESSQHRQIVNSFDMDGNRIDFLDPLAVVSLPANYREYAAFANASYRFSERFELHLGARYARNEQTFRQISSGAIVPEADDPGESDENVFTYSIAPQFHLSEDTMVYARLATGYRPGGPNVNFPGLQPTFESDEVESWELGFRTMALDRTLLLDVAAFYMDWDDIQVGISFGGVSGLGNGPSARTQGVEAALQWLPLDGLNIGLTGAYIDAELTADAPSIGGQDGDRLARVPKWSGALTTDYRFVAGRNTMASIGGGVRYTGSRYSNVESDPLTIDVPSATAIDLNGSLEFGARWTLRAYVRNLTDSDDPVTRSTSVDGLNTPTHITVMPLQPRTIGIVLDMSF